MWLIHLTCDSFRCLESLDFTPGRGLNIIRGGNAQGKTSVLEALLYATTTKSHRTTREEEMTRQGADGFRVTADVSRADRTIEIEGVWWRGVKRFKVNGAPQARLSDVLGRAHAVFYAPEDNALVRGSGAGRRRFLDMALSQASPPYLHLLQDYRQVLRQRNELVRLGPKADLVLLDVFDEQLGGLAEGVMAARGDFLITLSPLAENAYSRLAGEERLSVAYEPDMPVHVRCADILRASRKNDLRQGLTTHGPHRDDLEFLVNGRSARQYASQGQQRSVALALKFAEMAFLRERLGEPPILMLDDVLSELDEERSSRLLHLLGGDTQCLLTTTDCTASPSLMEGDCAVFRMINGSLKAE